MKYTHEDPNIPQPVKRPPVLKRIEEPAPPKHTQIQPRCVTCEHFSMCKYKEHYLKTITLMQNTLGAPSIDYELTDKYLTIPKFVGFSIGQGLRFFPKEIEFYNTEKGYYYAAKFNGINFVNIIYNKQKYYILLQFEYNEENEAYELKSSKEAFYRVEFDLTDESTEDLLSGLLEWRKAVLSKKALPVPPPPKKEIIDTTHFSASLDCDVYSWTKESYDDAVRRLSLEYPNGIPLNDNDPASPLYHIVTYHVEDKPVPYSPLYRQPGVADCPIENPKKKARRRKDL